MTRIGRVISLLIYLLLALTFVDQSAWASTVRMTMYADGKSCPGDCDQHVVFDQAMNGTEFAHVPGSAKPFQKCKVNADCEICLESSLKQCLIVLYRGAGPTHGTFDMTPAFYESRCALPNIPALLKTKCKELERAAAGLKDRINCIKDAENVACKETMDVARSMQRADLSIYKQCKAEKQDNFNKGKPIEQRRDNDCAYELKGTGGPNSKGIFWRKLLPGACRVESYVGRDGLDCCSGSTLADGPLGLECLAFYQERP